MAKKQLSAKTIAHINAEADAIIAKMKSHNAELQKMFGDQYDPDVTLTESVGLLGQKSPTIVIGLAAVALQRLATFANSEALPAELAELDFTYDPEVED